MGPAHRICIYFQAEFLAKWAGQSLKVLVIFKGEHGTKSTVLQMVSLRINDSRGGHGTMSSLNMLLNPLVGLSLTNDDGFSRVQAEQPNRAPLKASKSNPLSKTPLSKIP